MPIGLLLLCTALLSGYVEGPERATLTGSVADPSHAVIPGARIELQNADTNEVTTALTDHQGRYTVSALRAGSYSVSIEAAGFQRFARAGVLLTAEETVRLNVTLEVAMAAELITVAAKRSDFDEALEVREVRESAAKDVGEALARIDGLSKLRKGGVANDVVLRGFRQGNVNVIIDGARIYGACPNHMDPAVSHVDFAEIQQVEVTKGAFDMRHQGSLGGVVEVVSKAPAPGFSITPQLGASSFGYWNPALTAALSGENVSGLAGYSFRSSEPYRDGAGKRFTERANYQDASRDADAFDINTAWFRFGVAPRDKHRLEFSSTRQAVGQVLYPYLLMDAVYDHADRLGAAYLKPRVNLVPSVMNTAARSFENTPARMYGGELTYGAGLGRAIWFSGGLAWSRGSKEPTPALRILDRDLAEIPPFRGRAALRHARRNFFAEAEGVAVAAQERTDSDLREDSTPGYAVLNLQAGIHARKLNLAAGIDNLFDRLYYEHLSYQRDPFRFGAKIPEPAGPCFCRYPMRSDHHERRHDHESQS